MDLFSSGPDQNTNILPADGVVNYYGRVMPGQQADHYLERLLHNIEWKNDQAIILGKLLTTKRKVAWYADKVFEYRYSNITKTALPWTPELLELRSIAEAATGESYNSCLLNLYHSGTEGMAWHSDGEKDLKKDGAIASLSFGAERKFCFKHKQTKQVVPIILEHGSLLVMKGNTQRNWLHRLPPSTKVLKPRVNLTFRTIVQV